MRLKIFIPCLFFTLLFFKQAVAQRYIPLPEENVVWQQLEYFTYEPCFDHTTRIFYFGNDTLINNIQYKNLYTERIHTIFCDGGYDPIIDSFPKSLAAALRQDSLNKKVFIFLKDSLKEQLLYNFNLKVGDTITYFLADGGAPNIFGYLYPVVTSIDSILINGQFRKRYIYEFSYPTDQYFAPNALIEGIGNTRGLIYPRNYYDDESWIDLTCVTLNGNKIYRDFPFDGLDTIYCYSPGFSLPDITSSTSIYNKFFGNESDSIRVSLSATRIFFNIQDSANQTLTLEIVNVLGQICYQTDINAATQISLPKEALSVGLYIVALVSDKRVVDRVKFIKY